MPDIFISYAHQDHELIRDIAAALESKGWSVFWDRKIPPGETWHSYIGTALQNAKCVIVAWSEHSIHSNWVYEEATDALQRKVLLPLLLDSVQPPIGLRSIQATDLSDLRQGHSSSNLEQFISSIGLKLGQPAVTSSSSDLQSVKRTSTQWQKIAAASVLIFVVGLTAYFIYGNGAIIVIDDNSRKQSSSQAECAFLQPHSSLSAENDQQVEDSAKRLYERVKVSGTLDEGSMEEIRHMIKGVSNDKKVLVKQKAAYLVCEILAKNTTLSPVLKLNIQHSILNFEERTPALTDTSRLDMPPKTPARLSPVKQKDYFHPKGIYVGMLRPEFDAVMKGKDLTWLSHEGIPVAIHKGISLNHPGKGQYWFDGPLLTKAQIFINAYRKKSQTYYIKKHDSETRDEGISEIQREQACTDFQAYVSTLTGKVGPPIKESPGFIDRSEQLKDEIRQFDDCRNADRCEIDRAKYLMKHATFQVSNDAILNYTFSTMDVHWSAEFSAREVDVRNLSCNLELEIMAE